MKKRFGSIQQCMFYKYKFNKMTLHNHVLTLEYLEEFFMFLNDVYDEVLTEKNVYIVQFQNFKSNIFTDVSRINAETIYPLFNRQNYD